ncbi:MAG: Ig-like domain-containing domain [Daejeonella sp.]
MAKNRTLQFSQYFIAILFGILIIHSCASIQQPSGGPKDIQPPKVVKEIPKNLNRNFSGNKIEIQFDEFVKLNSEFTEISISPALDKMPSFKAKKSILDIKFEQPLDSNTTYTINFGKAIGDVNENNILKNYTYVFSTGNEIDSLTISGNVISTLTKENLKETTVFVLPVKQDSLFGKKRANIFTTTDSSGNFQFKNLREGKYFLYALKEQNNDRIYNAPLEEIGFVKDTINLKGNITDLKVEVFLEDPEKFRVQDKKIENDGRIVMVFNRPLIQPGLQIINPKELNSTKAFEFSAKKDSALIWLPALAFDSINVALSENGKNIDTQIIYRNKKDTYTRAITATDNVSTGKLRPGKNLELTFTAPVKEFDKSKIKLLQDSVELKNFEVLKDSSSARKLIIKNAWRTERSYELNLSENAVTDIYGNKSKIYNRQFNLDSEDNYGNIAIQVTVPDTSKSYIVQWLNEQDVILKSDQIKSNTTLNYFKFPTAKYHIRVVYDINKNGKWDTGRVKTREQPEVIWNFDKILTLRPNWDLEEKMTIPPPQ